MPQPVAIDTDFLNHLAETNGEQGHICALIMEFFQSLNVVPQMHELLWQYEVEQTNPVICQLIENQTIQIRPIVQTLKNDPTKKRYYDMLVRSIYRELYGEEYPCDVFNEWRHKKSLGEIHSVVMCMFLNYMCLLSDDKGAKDLKIVIQKKVNYSISICSRADCRNCLQQSQDKCTLKSSDLRRLCHVRS